jgi:hypothetical protein
MLKKKIISVEEYKNKCVELARALQLVEHLKGQLKLKKNVKERS